MRRLQSPFGLLPTPHPAQQPARAQAAQSSLSIPRGQRITENAFCRYDRPGRYIYRKKYDPKGQCQTHNDSNQRGCPIIALPIHYADIKANGSKRKENDKVSPIQQFHQYYKWQSQQCQEKL
jgi:hypothetical protein